MSEYLGLIRFSLTLNPFNSTDQIKGFANSADQDEMAFNDLIRICNVIRMACNDFIRICTVCLFYFVSIPIGMLF